MVPYGRMLRNHRQAQRLRRGVPSLFDKRTRSCLYRRLALGCSLMPVGVAPQCLCSSRRRWLESVKPEAAAISETDVVVKSA